MKPKVSLTDITFPVYVIGSKEPITDGKITYYLSGSDTKYSDAQYRFHIVDDKELPGKTLAARRLQLKAQGVLLKKITRAIFFMSDFIKIAKASTWFIDSNGLVFNYVKTKTVALVYKKIAKLIQMPQGGTIVEVEGVPGRFKTLFAPSTPVTYAGLLKDGNSYIFYGLYDKKYKDSHRMI